MAIMDANKQLKHWEKNLHFAILFQESVVISVPVIQGVRNKQIPHKR